MKVIHIVPGSGGTFYCQNCMRDTALVPALRKAGIDALIMPLYLPLFTDGNSLDESQPVFFGGINTWLQQKIPLFRRTPRWLDRLFDARCLLKKVAKLEGSTTPTSLGSMQLSMLKGEAGNQRKEVLRLMEHLKTIENPDIIHISNALLLGLAKTIKRELQVPIVCSLQDEEQWLDAIDEPYRTQCWNVLQEQKEHIDLFVAVSHWYAKQMKERLNLKSKQIEVIHIGIDLDGYQTAPLDFNPPVIGFLSRLNANGGLDRLMDSFLTLKKNPNLKNLRLRATGGLVGDDQKKLNKLKKKIAKAGYENDVDFLPEFDREQRISFLKTISVMCVPTPNPEAFGTFIIEAMAAGVPVIQPKIGAFTELIEATGGGLTYTDNLNVQLSDLLLNPATAKSMGKKGQEAVKQHFSIEQMAERMINTYKALST